MFKDHFSTQAADYARYRPQYPSEIFKLILENVTRRELAWDCATGSGQAAHTLAAHFRRVIASDASSSQIAHALPPVANVEYRVFPAEQPEIPAGSVDLITVAQALHWFEWDSFYRAVRTVAHPRALLAIWGYGINHIEPGLDELVLHFYNDLVGTYWPPERKLIESEYDEIPFPFERIPGPEIEMSKCMTSADFLGYLGTWSAVVRYRAAHQSDPITLIADELRSRWGDAPRKVYWRFFYRLGRVHS
ncbi:MAG: class I SAM-dependent methyltransferase [Leptospiraceae bacterium]|nr:class I SAM-dependent methyltransferase [Leptospiraceae bacterium]MCB1315057.1 class I SAM-dependent methyltransferase [Leptospiraceae bacterium]